MRYGNLPLCEFLVVYLRKHDSDNTTLASWAYSVRHAVERHMYDPDMELFALVLDDRVPEQVLVEQHEMLRSVEALAKRLSSAEGSPEGHVLAPNFLQSLQLLFPAKPEPHMRVLRQRLAEMQHDSLLPVFSLLRPGPDGMRSGFCKALTQQHWVEIRELWARLQARLLAASPARDGRVPVHAIPPALRQADPNVTRRSMNVLLARGLGCTVRDLTALLLRSSSATARLVSVEEFMCNLLASGLMRPTNQCAHRCELVVQQRYDDAKLAKSRALPSLGLASATSLVAADPSPSPRERPPPQRSRTLTPRGSGATWAMLRRQGGEQRASALRSEQLGESGGSAAGPTMDDARLPVAPTLRSAEGGRPVVSVASPLTRGRQLRAPTVESAAGM